MTSVVPERSAPIMMTGRSLRLIGILCDFEVSDPGEKVEKHFRIRRLEAGQPDLLQNGLAAVSGIERDDRPAQLCDLLFRDLGRRDEGHVGQLPASRENAA